MRTAARPAILVVAPTADLTFVAQDVRILSRAYDVDVVTRQQHPSLRRLLPAVAQRLRARRHGLLYVWFAEPYDSPFLVYLARLLGVRSAIAVGGYDVTAIPALAYGALADRRGRWKVRLALRGADAVLPTSDLLADEVRRLGRTRDVDVIYPGVDCGRFAPGDGRERLVLTVGTVGASTWRLKGLDVFARCSRMLPDVRFAVIGPHRDDGLARELQARGGENLTLLGGVDQEGVAAWFRRATVYAQLSARESFGLAVAEAMSAGCVPVVTAVGFLPVLVGDTGFLVEYGDEAAAGRAIACALESDGGVRARERVRRLYSLEKREQALLRRVERLVTGS